MPIFPFHTWQPDTYEQSPTAVTMVLSGLMVKMGVFGLIRWLAPVLPMGTYMWGDTVSTLSIIGMIYASLIAMQQDDLKRLVAYSSIAHIGLMCVAIFATTEPGIQGVMIQMFNHGINIIGLWIVVFLIEKQFGTRKISELGGLAAKAPVLTLMLVIITLANIALPLTNGFIGEFLMFTGIYSSRATTYNVIFTVDSSHYGYFVSSLYAEHGAAGILWTNQCTNGKSNRFTPGRKNDTCIYSDTDIDRRCLSGTSVPAYTGCGGHVAVKNVR